MSGENTANTMRQGGAQWDIGKTAGGSLTVDDVDVTNGLQNLAPANGAEVVTETNAITAAECEGVGKTFYLDSATEFVSTLPAPAVGLRCRFIVKTPPAGASYTVVTNGSANILRGHIVSGQDAAGSADYETNGGDTITFVDGKADVGDRVDLESDGTYWYMRGSSFQYDAITCTTAS